MTNAIGNLTGTSFGTPFSNPVSGLRRPPLWSTKLLNWHPGIKREDIVIDRKSGFGLVMTQSNCTTLDGVNEYGASNVTVEASLGFDISIRFVAEKNDMFLLGNGNVSGSVMFSFGGNKLRCYLKTDNGFFYSNSTINVVGTGEHVARFVFDGISTITQYVDGAEEGSATITGNISHDTTPFTLGKWLTGSFHQGQIFDCTINGTHFRIAEGNASPRSYSDNYPTDGRYIAWTGDLAAMWASRQDVYHGNANLGWWEIDGDPVKYPFPVVGFTTYHPANKLTPCETLLAYKEDPVGTMDGSVTEINLPFNVPAGSTLTYDGTATAGLDIVNNKITDTSSIGGTIRNIVITDSGSVVLASYKVDEREGGTVADSSGNGQTATITGVLVDFWADSLVPVEIMAMEAVQGANLYTDGNGHALPQPQSVLEELGGELVEDVDIDSGDGFDATGGWSIANSKATNDGTNDWGLTHDASVVGGSLYRVRILMSGVLSGGLYYSIGKGYASNKVDVGSNGLHEFDVTCDEQADQKGFFYPINTFVGSIESVSVREVNPIVNHNKQNYIGPKGVINLAEVATDEEDLKTKKYLGIE
jgi:Concanavalin A-like lectin/glucanases superfamily